MGPGTAIGQVLERWNQLPRARQIALGGILAGAIVLAYLVFSASSQPNLVVAYTGLAPEDSAAMADQLTKDGVPYELGGGGSTISVPANRVAEVRIKLAQAGLGKGGGVGMEIFDKQSFGITDFAQQVNYVRAIEGELARSINSLAGVRSSRVHVVLPKEALFKQDQKETTAGVVVAMKPGKTLDQSQVKGITNLVTNSVEGLKPGGITVIDEAGHVLYDGAVQDSPFSTGATSTQLETQRQYELSLQRDVENTLARVVGVGRSAVTVRARLNFDSVKSVEDKFGAPNSVIPRSSSSTTETYNGNNQNVANIPGTGTNGATNTAAATTVAGASQYSRTETTTNNEIPKTTSTTVKAPGSLDKLSVSVVLDESVTAAQEASITQAVAAAVGLDQVRGDTLSVTRMPFDGSVANDLTVPAGDGLGQYLQYLKLLLPMLAVLLAFVLVMLLLRSLSKRQEAAYPGGVLRPQLIAAGMAGLNQPSALPALEAARPDPQEERVLALATQNPRAVADVVQTWIREEDH